MHVQETSTKVVFGVDDGTGVITCLLWDAKRPSESADEAQVAHARVEARRVEMAKENVRLGAQIRCLGRVEIYQEMKQVVVEDVQLLEDPNEELLHWIEVMVLSRKFYHKINHAEASPPAPRTTAPPTDQGSEPEDALKNKLLEHVTQALQGRREDFHKNDVLKAEELIAYVLSIEPGENTESDAMRRARAVARINTEFQSLVGAGEICEVDPLEGTFCLPDQSLELEPVVFAFLQRRAAEGYATTTFEEVQEHVTVDTMVYGANWQKISHSLDGLVASSKVYEVEEGHYCLV